MSELKTMFRLFRRIITEHDIIKETNHRITFINEYGRESTESKISDWQSWHNTRAEAMQQIIKREERKIKSNESQIETLTKEIKERKEYLEQINKELKQLK